MKGHRDDGQGAAERAFVEKAMTMIRQTLYPHISDAQFAREWRDLLLAVSEPAQYLHSRGLKLPGSRYMAILREVLQDILRGGKPRSRSLPIYLRQCVQEHMRIKGERYLEEAKDLDAGRPAGAEATRILRGLKPVPGDPDADRLTAALVAARGLILPPSRPRRQAP